MKTVTIDVGAAEYRALRKIVEAASQGALVRLTAKERGQMSQLHRRLSIADDLQ